MVNNGGDWFPIVNNSGDNKVRVWCQGRIDRDIARERERERKRDIEIDTQIETYGVTCNRIL